MSTVAVGVPAAASADQQAMRDSVADGMCPFCGVGPFAVVAAHVTRMHDLDRREFREALGVYWKTSICDPGHSSAVQRRARRAWRNGAGERATAARLVSTSRRVLSPAAIDRNRQLAAANREVIVAVLKSNAEQIHRDRLPEYERWRSAWNTGASIQEMAGQFGVHPRTVSRGLRRLGIDLGGENYRRRKRGNLHGLDVGHEMHRRESAAKRKRRVSRFAELGSDWDALGVLAREEGIGRTSLRDQLKRCGVSVPDGRAGAH